MADITKISIITINKFLKDFTNHCFFFITAYGKIGHRDISTQSSLVEVELVNLALWDTNNDIPSEDQTHFTKTRLLNPLPQVTLNF